MDRVLDTGVYEVSGVLCILAGMGFKSTYARDHWKCSVRPVNPRPFNSMAVKSDHSSLACAQRSSALYQKKAAKPI